MKKYWFALLIIVSLGLITAIVLNLSNLNNPILYLRTDTGTLVFLISLFISLLGALSGLMINYFQIRRKDEIQQTIEDRRRFIRLLDHELKNPLTAIMAGLANINSNEDESQRTAATHSVQTQVQRLNRLVSDIRKLSDLEIRELEIIEVDLNNLLQEVYEQALEHPFANGKKIDLQIPQAPWPLPNIMGDPDLLFLAIYNLIDNALKFSEPEDTIEIRGSENDDVVVIEIADTGVGIPEDEVPEVWNELYRGKDALAVPGSGMGLALVRAIVSRHSGEITMRSRSKQGTVITINLPVNPVTKR